MKSLMFHDVVVLDTYENTYRRGIVIEHGPAFLTIEIQPTTSRSTSHQYQYPIKDIDAGEFIVYVKE